MDDFDDDELPVRSGTIYANSPEEAMAELAKVLEAAGFHLDKIKSVDTFDDGNVQVTVIDLGDIRKNSAGLLESADSDEGLTNLGDWDDGEEGDGWDGW